MSRIVLPGQNVKMDENSGIDPIWYEKLQQLTAFVNLFSEVNFNTVTNGYVMKWDATARKFVAGPDLT